MTSKTFETHSERTEIKDPEISVVIPVYKGEPFLKTLVERITRTIIKIGATFEIILVEDCGPDNSWEVIKSLRGEFDQLVGIQLSRNFGQHKAITAGLTKARGTYIVVMDCDLQDVPEEIEKLYNKILDGYDVVFARRSFRNDSAAKKFASKSFYLLFGYLTETQQDSSIGNFGIYKRKVITAILSMDDTFRYFPAMVRWVGFRTSAVDVIHSKRSIGESSYNLRQALHLATDTILAFSDKTLRITVKAGIVLALSAFLMAIVVFISAAQGKFSQAGWASVIISVWFFSGLIITSLGIVGLYVGKCFEQSKNRPKFIISETI